MMTKPPDIEQWAWDRAAMLVFDIDADWTSDDRKCGEINKAVACALIARALTAAAYEGIYHD